MADRGRRLSCAQPTAQRPQPTKLNTTGSLELVKSLLRLVIYQIVYARRMFPVSSFRKCSLPNLEGLEVQMLLPVCSDAKQLIAWIEQGVCDALKQGYLGSLRFGVSSDDSAADILEEFKLLFKYSDSGACSFDYEHSEAGKGAGAGDAAPSQQASCVATAGCSTNVEDVKHQVASIIRKLTSTCHTLGPLPSKRCIYMKLVYNDSCPENYQPAHFRDFAPAEGELQAQQDALERGVNIAIGDFATEHHGVTLGVASHMDQFPYSQDPISQLDIAEEEAPEHTRKDSRPTASAAPSAMQSSCVSCQASDVTRDPVMDDRLEQVATYCRVLPGIPFVSNNTLLLAFPEIPQPTMEIIIDILCDKRFLRPCTGVGESGEYEILAQHEPCSIPPTQPLSELAPVDAESDQAPPDEPKPCSSARSASPGMQATQPEDETPPAENPKTDSELKVVAQYERICTESMDLAVLLAEQKRVPDKGQATPSPVAATQPNGDPDAMVVDTQATTQPMVDGGETAQEAGASEAPRQKQKKRQRKSSVVERPIFQPKRMRTRSMSQPQSGRSQARKWEDDFLWPSLATQ